MKQALKNTSYFAEFTLDESGDRYRLMGWVEKYIHGKRHEAVYNRTEYMKHPERCDEPCAGDKLVKWLDWETEVTITNPDFLKKV
jgi:hypothetical protein